MFYVIYPELWKLLIKNENFVIVEQGGGGPFDVSGGPFVVLEILEKNLKYSKFFQTFHWFGVYNIKHNLARSCFQFWPSKSRQIMFYTRKTNTFTFFPLAYMENFQLVSHQKIGELLCEAATSINSCLMEGFKEKSERAVCRILPTGSFL